MADSEAHVSADPDLAAVASAFADPRRIRVLMALCDGRALPAGRLAAEAGVAASTVSSHLSILLAQNLVDVEQHGRSRYYRLATPEVEAVLEALAGLAPQRPITSLRQHTRAHALRTGRTCYRHLAGKLGVDLFQSMLSRGWVVGGDGRFRADAGDRLSAPGTAIEYRLTAKGADRLAEFALPQHLLRPGAALSYCVDWTEQAHHLAGPLGTALTAAMFEAGWIVRGKTPRSVVATQSGERRLANL